MEELLRILSEACPGVDFEQETALIDDGILESLDLVNIVFELMNEFEVEITVNDLVPEHFNSVQAIWDLIQDKRG
jgi:acyl carrier protein